MAKNPVWGHPDDRKTAKLPSTADKSTLFQVDRELRDEVYDRFNAYQASNIASDHWVLMDVRDSGIALSGTKKNVEAAIKKMEGFKKLAQQNFNDRAPQVIKTKDGAYFKQGDLKFTVDATDLNKVVDGNREGTPIDQLMDSQVVMMAQANGLLVKPYSRELLRPVLIGILQLAWYRCFEPAGHDWDHLNENHFNRIKWYLHSLKSYRETPEGNGEEKPRRSRDTFKWVKSYQIVAGKRAAASLSGRELQVFNVIAGLKTAATLAQIVEAAKGKVDTKQDLQKIVSRFIGKLVAAGAVQEVKNG